MPSTNEIIADDLVGSAIDLLRFSASARRKVLGILFAMEEELETLLRRADLEGLRRGSAKLARAEVLLKQTRKTIDSAYRASDAALGSEIRDLVKFSAAEAVGTINSAFKADIASAVFTRADVASVVDNQLLIGGPLKEWWSQQSRTTAVNFAREVRQGALLGQTNDEIVRRIRGKATGRFVSIESAGKIRKARELAGGIMDIGRRNAETLVRSAVMNASNDAMMSAYRKNSDIVKAVIAIATLDSRTSDICIARSGAMWDLATGEPLPASPRKERFPGPPPWHPACRTILGPVTRSWEELAEAATGRRLKGKLRTVPDSVRASADGEVPGDLSWQGFLGRKGDAFARAKLGPGRFDLWKRGKISLSQLVDQTGRPLTLDQLRALRGPSTIAPSAA